MSVSSPQVAHSPSVHLCHLVACLVSRAQLPVLPPPPASPSGLQQVGKHIV